MQQRPQPTPQQGDKPQPPMAQRVVEGARLPFVKPLERAPQ
jgi:hypothetical protein